MIEATLDQTLPRARPSGLDAETIQCALQQFKGPVSLENFIRRLVHATGVARPQVEDAFWALINSGEAVLTPDFQVKVRR